MPGRGLGIVQELERVPAGVELGLGAVGGRLGGMARRDAVGELGLVLLDQGARDQTALDPPGIGVDQLAGVSGGRQQQLGGLVDLVGTAQRLNARIKGERIVPHRPGQGGQLAIGGLALLDRRDHRLGERQLVLADEGGDAQCIVRLPVIEQPVHARLVVRGGQQVAELGEDGLLVRPGDVLVAPEAADERGRVLLPAAGDVGLRQLDGGGVGDRLGRAERLDDARGGQVLAGNRLFVADAQERLAGPVAELLAHRQDARGGHRLAAAGGDQPVDDLDVDRVGQGIGGDGRRSRVAVVDELQGQLEPGRVQRRRNRRGGRGDRRRIRRGRIARLRRIAVLGSAAFVGGLVDDRGNGIVRGPAAAGSEADAGLRLGNGTAEAAFLPAASAPGAAATRTSASTATMHATAEPNR